MQRFIKLFICFVLVGCLALAEKCVIHEILTAQTFAVARIWFGLALFGLACITMVILFLIGEIETWRFDRLVYQGDSNLSTGNIELAQRFYLKAQRINDRWMRSKTLRLLILNKLLPIYRALDDQTSYADVSHRIHAIEHAAGVPRLEELMPRENLASEKDAISSLIKRPENYIIATVFAISLCLLGWYFMPPQSGFPITNELIIRLGGAILIAITIGEALSGKAPGGNGPTAYWDKTPYWFTFRAGCFLYFGVIMVFRFDRLWLTKGYWQLPADLKTGLVSFGSLTLCCLVCYVLAYLKNYSSSSK
jgi:hypothetical protein